MKSLSNLRRRIEKSVAESGTNVALYYIEHSQYYKNFEERLTKALYGQIRQVCTASHINNLLLFTKAKTAITPIEVQINTVMDSLGALMDFDTFTKKVATATGQLKVDLYGAEGKFLMQNPKILNYFADHNNLLITTVDDTTKSWIAAKIQEGSENFLTPAEIAKSIESEAWAISEVRARRIVLTETANAVSVTQKEVALEYGIMEQVWRTSLDEKVCDECAPLEGQKVSIGENYNNATTNETPLHPPAHPECRCYLEDVIPEDWGLPIDPWMGE